MIKNSLFIAVAIIMAFSLLLSCGKGSSNLGKTVITPVDTAKPVTPVYALVWSDEFSGTSVDTTKWNFETGGGGWGNSELEYYQASNATVANGYLMINAKSQSVGGESYTSVRMTTQNKFSQTFGRVEARIKMPVGMGLWPAFWMLGANINTVSWPNCGEVDIMEHINADSLNHGSLHWNGGNTTQQLATTPSQFHIYAVEWNATQIRFYVDNTLYDTESTATIQAFQLPFFIIMNVAVGGNWPGFTIDQTALPAVMYVDYVRVYKQTN